jgi:Ca2+/Na+ antiporter
MAFDAMRAYHCSEIEHKKDMISILNGIFLSIITVFAGIAYFIITKDYEKYHSLVLLIVFAIATLYVLLILALQRSSKAKIASDNVRYEQFREECCKEREYLQLKSFFGTSQTYWEMPSVFRDGTGHEVTRSFVGNYSRILIAIVISLSLLALGLLAIK